MRIALLSPLFESVPPKLYGGTERVVANLCRGLTELGHEVTLFASGDSRTPCETIATVPHALRLAGVKVADQGAYHTAQLGAAARRAHEFDIIHNHMDYLALPLSLLVDIPVVSTLHGRLDSTDVVHVLSQFDDAPLVSISESQRSPVPQLNWVATVYHGLPLEDFKLYPKPGNYLAFLGRMSREKRPDLAIQIAKLSGVPLKMAAKIEAGPDRDYFDAEVAPHIDGSFIEYIGEITEREKNEFLGKSLGLVFPIDWPEPFGIAPVEAWASGTPVLARPYGSVPELHQDGVSGFVRDDATELAALVQSLSSLDRQAIRAYAERRFSLQSMCEGYVDVYKRLRHEESQALQFKQPFGAGRGLLHSISGSASRHP